MRGPIPEDLVKRDDGMRLTILSRVDHVQALLRRRLAEDDEFSLLMELPNWIQA